MSAERHFYEPKAGHGLAHDPFNSIVAPRPIGWISTHNGEGGRNLAPYSFFNALNYRPPMIGFASIGWKDTVRNIEKSREFVWNLATKALAEGMNVSSTTTGPEVDEFDLAGVEAAPSKLITAPRVAAAPVNFECRLADIIQLKTASGDTVDTWFVTGEVVGVHIDGQYLKDGVYQTAAPHPILRAGGLGGYAEITPASMFELMRPG